MKKQIVSYLIENNELVKPEILERLKDPNTLKKAAKLVEEKAEAKQIIDVIKTNQAKEKETKETEHKQNNRDGEDEDKWAVKVLFDYEKPALKKNVESFTKYFNNRFKQIEKLLLPRAENNISISRLANKTDRETVTVIGMIADKQLTKTNKVILTLEDQTGTIKALFSPNNQETYKMAKDTVLDEVISVTGTAMKDLLFAEKMMLPEIPIRTEIKKSPEEAYAIFIADVHLGSNLFLEEEFGNFIDWLRGEYGTEEQKEIAKKTKYCFIAGDLVAGVGIYPKQEEELKITDIYQQYKQFTEYIKKIPTNIKVIIIPGNHDAGRIAEPQPRIDKEFVEDLYDRPNIYLLSNPALVNIAATKEFEGFNVLLYHGYSYDYYSDNVESIRMSGKEISDRPVLVSKFLLQRRHLAPTHQSTLTMPDPEKDPLFIETVPDIFVTGHIHKSAISSYRGTTIIAASSWEKQTSYQEKFGHKPDLCKVIAINLKTRKPTIIDFEQHQ